MNLRVFIALLLLPSLALADLKSIPPWTMVDGRACYGFDDAKKLVALDAELQLCAAYKDAFPRLQKDLADIRAALPKRDLELKLANDALADSKTRLDACIDERAAAQAKAASGPSVAWLVAGAAVLTLAGFLVGSRVK